MTGWIAYVYEIRLDAWRLELPEPWKRQQRALRWWSSVCDVRVFRDFRRQQLFDCAATSHSREALAERRVNPANLFIRFSSARILRPCILRGFPISGFLASSVPSAIHPIFVFFFRVSFPGCPEKVDI
jgi:hypothetical protein